MRKRLLGTVFTFAASVFLWTAAQAQNCREINEFEGLIFDGGAFVSPEGMETYLDKALLAGVEKIALYPYPHSSAENKPEALERIFPDLVLQGASPWSKAPPVIWPEPLVAEDLGLLKDEMERHAERTYLLSALHRFSPQMLIKMVKQHHNLWLGLDGQDVQNLLKNCGGEPWGKVIEAAQNRLVFASFGGKENWRHYGRTIADLRKLAALMSEQEADALMFRNAQELFNVAVNAP